MGVNFFLAFGCYATYGTISISPFLFVVDIFIFSDANYGRIQALRSICFEVVSGLKVNLGN